MTDLEQIRERLALGAEYTPEQMRQDLVYMLESAAKADAMIEEVLNRPGAAVNAHHTVLCMVTADLRRERELHKKAQAEIVQLHKLYGELQRWVRESRKGTDAPPCAGLSACGGGD